MITPKTLTNINDYLMEAYLDFMSCDGACNQCCCYSECLNFKNAMATSLRALRKLNEKIVEEYKFVKKITYSKPIDKSTNL